MFRGRRVIEGNGELRRQAFKELRCNSIGGILDRSTLKKVMDCSHSPTIRQNVGKWIRECAVCQKHKGEHVKSPGLLDP